MRAPSNPRARLAFGLLSAALAGLVACTSDGANPEPPTSFKVDSGTSAGDAGASTDAEGSDSGFDAGADTAGCLGDAGCWGCKPASDEQFLNRCSGSQCSKFDDKTRIPSSVWDGGALPAVP